MGHQIFEAQASGGFNTPPPTATSSSCWKVEDNHLQLGMAHWGISRHKKWPVMRLAHQFSSSQPLFWIIGILGRKSFVCWTSCLSIAGVCMVAGVAIGLLSALWALCQAILFTILLTDPCASQHPRQGYFLFIKPFLLSTTASFSVMPLVILYKKLSLGKLSWLPPLLAFLP